MTPKYFQTCYIFDKNGTKMVPMYSGSAPLFAIWAPKGAQGLPKGAPRAPMAPILDTNGAPRVPKGSQGSHFGHQKTPQGLHFGTRAPQGLLRHILYCHER